jgi:hypothetical protein
MAREPSPHGVIASIGRQVITALPGQMLLMLLLNLAFLGALFWLLAQQNASRERILAPLLAACSETIPLRAFPQGLSPNLPDQP